MTDTTIYSNPMPQANMQKTKNMEYKEIYNRYDGEIPDDIKAEYYESVDRFRTSELDLDFMDEINFFFEEQH